MSSLEKRIQYNTLPSRTRALDCQIVFLWAAVGQQGDTCGVIIIFAGTARERAPWNVLHVAQIGALRVRTEPLTLRRSARGLRISPLESLPRRKSPRGTPGPLCPLVLLYHPCRVCVCACRSKSACGSERGLEYLSIRAQSMPDSMQENGLTVQGKEPYQWIWSAGG